MPIIVGAHPQNPSLSILARRPDALARLAAHDIGFFIYGAGSQTIPLIKAGVIQLAGTGAPPPFSPRRRACRLPSSASAIPARNEADCSCVKIRAYRT